MFCSFTPLAAAFFKRRDDFSLAERCALALHEAEFRLQVRWIESGRRRRNRAIGEKFFRDQHGAAVELGEIDGIEQPCPELALQAVVGQDARAVDLVFHRRFREHAGLPVVAKHLQEIVGAEIANGGFRRMRDLQIGLDAVDVVMSE